MPLVFWVFTCVFISCWLSNPGILVTFVHQAFSVPLVSIWYSARILALFSAFVVYVCKFGGWTKPRSLFVYLVPEILANLCSHLFLWHSRRTCMFVRMLWPLSLCWWFCLWLVLCVASRSMCSWGLVWSYCKHYSVWILLFRCQRVACAWAIVSPGGTWLDCSWFCPFHVLDVFPAFSSGILIHYLS